MCLMHICTYLCAINHSYKTFVCYVMSKFNMYNKEEVGTFLQQNQKKEKDFLK